MMKNYIYLSIFIWPCFNISLIFFNWSLKDCTSHSAWLFIVRWCWAELKWCVFVIIGHKFFKIGTGGAVGIICHILVCQAIFHKGATQFQDCSTWTCCIHRIYIQPFRLDNNNDQEHFPYNVFIKSWQPLWARAFILHTPRCISWSSYIFFACEIWLDGVMTCSIKPFKQDKSQNTFFNHWPAFDR